LEFFWCLLALGWKLSTHFHQKLILLQRTTATKAYAGNAKLKIQVRCCTREENVFSGVFRWWLDQSKTSQLPSPKFVETLLGPASNVDKSTALPHRGRGRLWVLTIGFRL
jgi:hypothetical protein